MSKAKSSWEGHLEYIILAKDLSFLFPPADLFCWKQKQQEIRRFSNYSNSSYAGSRQPSELV